MAKVDIGDNSYDSFADVEFATEYLGGDVVRAAGWALRTPDAQARGLVSATRLLLSIPWVAPAPTVAAAPLLVKQVTAELAEDLLANPELFADASGDSNVKSVKAGSASVEFFRPVVGGPPIPSALWRRLLAAGLVSSPVTSDGGIAGALVHGISSGVRPYLGRPAWDYPLLGTDRE